MTSPFYKGNPFMKNILFISCIVLFSSSLPNHLVAEESVNATLPTVPIGKPDQRQQLKLELEMTAPKIVYRQPLSWQFRFLNQGITSMEVCLNDSEGILLGDAFLRWTLDGKERPDGGFRNGFQKSVFVLPPKESLTIKMPAKLFFMGKHRFSVKYNDPFHGGTEIESNVVDLEIKDEPLNNIDLQNADGKYRMIINEMRNDDFIKKTHCREMIQNALLIGSPYSVPSLKRSLVNEQKPEWRIGITEIIGLIADKERAAKIGYIRDTSAADLVIERIGKESDAPTLAALLKIIGKFFDVLDQPQRQKLEKSGLVQLSHQDAGVRVQAALTLLELFPTQRGSIETALAKPDFADAAGRKTIAEAMAKAPIR